VEGLAVKTAQAITASDAYDRHRSSGKAAAQQARIVEFIESRGGDWSIGELAHALGLEKSTVSARVWECLHESHALVEATRRKDRRSSVLVRPVMLPVVGQQELFK
jgi:transposase